LKKTTKNASKPIEYWDKQLKIIVSLEKNEGFGTIKNSVKMGNGFLQRERNTRNE
jgi:hypothetical protein